MTTRASLQLPDAAGAVIQYNAGHGDPPAFDPRLASLAPSRTRVAYSAVHVVSNPLAAVSDPTVDVAIDWDETMAYRHHLWSLGLSVAEAMDTAQRGMGLDWAASQALIRRSLADARAIGAVDRIACGAGTDHLKPGPGVTITDVKRAYDEQCAYVEGEGGRVILMASRALAACARGPEDYASVYDHVFSQIRQPVILHWLGDMFDPALAGYWGSSDIPAAMDSCVAVINANRAKIDGIKLSLLDDAWEVYLRDRLPASVRMYTGDDFNYPKLIAGDENRHSDALLGIFDAIAPAAAAALAALDAGDHARYDAIFEPTVPLARHIFRAPTRSYKTGIVFLSYVNGRQKHFRMIGGQESARSIIHLAELFRLADRAGLLVDVDDACARFRPVLELAGVPQS
ncbi:MAG: dihydrodipicolinate synthase family protein [Proteobacteria bacterium]|nr:dihydrodipicolinate synthase family protein [Pseudomonadota bacterium]